MQTNRNLASRLVKIAVVYLVIGLGLGLFMAMGHDYSLMSVHAHVTFLGWMTLGLAGLIYRAWPHCDESKLAGWHFWLHNLSLPVMMISHALRTMGHAAIEPVLGISSMVLVLALLLFTINVLKNVRATT